METQLTLAIRTFVDVMAKHDNPGATPMCDGVGRQTRWLRKWEPTSKPGWVVVEGFNGYHGPSESGFVVFTDGSTLVIGAGAGRPGARAIVDGLGATLGRHGVEI
jgi:hypothetical protein